MSIEHRWARRQRAQLSVSVACRGLGLLHGRLHNISNGGALVQVDTPLPVNTPVELILRPPIGIGARSYRLAAIVTRRGDEGTGLMFGRIDTTEWATLLTQPGPSAGVGFRNIDAVDFAPATSSG